MTSSTIDWTNQLIGCALLTTQSLLSLQSSFAARITPVSVQRSLTRFPGHLF